MKSVIATVLAVAALTAPALASEPTFNLRASDQAPSARAAARDSGDVTSATEAAPARKIRIVLASPYGN